ncbi:MAG: hypothetical protein ACTSUE_14615 [Promethearchaeota archaeon]
MRPPECAYCGVEEDCELVSFKKGEKDLEWEARMEKIGGVGHPPWVDWFCKEHAVVAKKYTQMKRKEAWIKIKEELKGKGPLRP